MKSMCGEGDLGFGYPLAVIAPPPSLSDQLERGFGCSVASFSTCPGLGGPFSDQVRKGVLAAARRPFRPVPAYGGPFSNQVRKGVLAAARRPFRP